MKEPRQSASKAETPTVKHPPTAKRSGRRRRTLAIAVAAALVIAVVGIARRLPVPANPTSGAQPLPPALASEAAPATPAAAPPAVVTARVVNEPSNKAAGQATKRRAVKSAAALPAPVIAAPEEHDSANDPAASEPVPTAPEPAAGSTASGAPAPVTITGCLEISADQSEFRLTDTEGVAAPKARSWRTGFLKKRSAPVALIEVPDRLALKRDVGKQVAATGLLNSHELKLSSLRIVRSSCN